MLQEHAMYKLFFCSCDFDQRKLIEEFALAYSPIEMKSIMMGKHSSKQQACQQMQDAENTHAQFKQKMKIRCRKWGESINTESLSQMEYFLYQGQVW